MKHLGKITATPEQLKIISTNQYGAELIRGAAGSGKTTTALLRLSSLANMVRARKNRLDDETPVRVLLLTFNSTLAGYVAALAQAQVQGADHQIEIETFAKWAMTRLGIGRIDADAAGSILRRMARGFKELDAAYLVSETEYLLGRFEPEKLDDYVTAERTGRGAMPRVDANLRQKILDDVVRPYLVEVARKGLTDWPSLAVRMRRDLASLQYDIIVVDESQDFSANEIRAIQHHLADDHAITFVTDTTQRLYARGFTWAEAGVSITASRSHRLQENHRNTKQIAAFAAGILDGITVDNDGSMPDLDAASTVGSPPDVIVGRYAAQIAWAIDYIKRAVDLKNESVAFLKPQGGGWFDTIREHLDAAGIGYVELQRNSRWPRGPENVAISTFHSSKGLEFDHVIILGFNQENTKFSDEAMSDQIQVLRRALAVAVARARKHVAVGYKLGEESKLTQYFEAGTYKRSTL